MAFVAEQAAQIILGAAILMSFMPTLTALGPIALASLLAASALVIPYMGTHLLVTYLTHEQNKLFDESSNAGASIAAHFLALAMHGLVDIGFAVATAAIGAAVFGLAMIPIILAAIAGTVAIYITYGAALGIYEAVKISTASEEAKPTSLQNGYPYQTQKSPRLFTNTSVLTQMVSGVAPLPTLDDVNPLSLFRSN
jgi:hypothetical protein